MSLEMGDFGSAFAVLLSDLKHMTLCTSYDQQYIVNGIYKFHPCALLISQRFKNVSLILYFLFTCMQISLVNNHNVNTVLLLHLSFNTAHLPMLLGSLSS